MLTLNTYSSSNNNGANIFWGSCSLETSNQKFFPSYIGSVFWGVKCGTQQFYGILKKLAPYIRWPSYFAVTVIELIKANFKFLIAGRKHVV